VSTLFTIGHSTRSLDELLALLRAHGIRRLVDVRRFPGSRRYPHFGRDALAVALPESGIAYVHEEALGGRRESDAAEDSPNRAWRSASFRAYADYMASDAFRAALDRVLDAGRDTPTAVMCAEAVPWRCHRQLSADAAVARGWRVLHVLDERRADEHALRAEARVLDDGTVIYPGAAAPESGQGELL
jgi:uncharacterized protein (DUF488 family)